VLLLVLARELHFEHPRSRKLLSFLPSIIQIPRPWIMEWPCGLEGGGIPRPLDDLSGLGAELTPGKTTD
jgi:hypothetical protein